MKRRLADGGIELLLVAWTVLIIGPFISVILLSFRSTLDIFEHPLGFTGSWDVGNFGAAWRGAAGSVGLKSLFVNSVVVSLIAVVVSIGAGTVCAYCICRLPARAQRWALRYFLAGIVVPIVLFMIPLYTVTDSLGLINQAWVAGVIYGAVSLPVVVLIMHGFYRDFPEEILDAARMDGATEASVFRRIVVPMSKSSMLTVAIVVLIFVWGEAQLGVILLQSPTSRTLAVGLLGFEGEYTTNYGALFAGLVLAMAPVAIGYFALSGRITKGIALSAGVKG